MPERDNPPAHGPGWWVLVIGGITLSLGLILATVLLVGTAAAVIFGIRTVPLPASPVPIAVNVQVTATPPRSTATPSADVPPNWTLLTDDSFDDNTNDWNLRSFSLPDASTERTIQDGRFRWVWFRSQEARDYMRCAACDRIRDSFVSVEATIDRVESASGYIGVMSRQRHGADYYACLINNEAQVAAIRNDMDGDQLIFLEYWQPHSAVNPEGTNTIAMRMEGRELSCYVNDEWILTVNDGALDDGGVGLLVGVGYEGGTIEAHFDNFQVFVPPDQD